MAREGHTAWTPRSLPDSIVLLGGGGGGSATELSAEIFPGNFKAFNINNFPRVEEHSNLNTVGILHVEYKTETVL